MNRKHLLLLFFVSLGAGIVWLKFHGEGQKSAFQTPKDVASAANQTDSKNTKPRSSPKEPALREKFCADSYATICSSAWPSLDPTGRVRPDISGEVRALRFMRNLIRENPSWTSEQVQDELAKVIFTPTRRKRIEDGFHWVVQETERFIMNQPASVLSDIEKQALLDRIARIQLELPPPAAVYADAVDLITKNTVYYERTPKNVLRLRIGGAYLLNTTSWYNVVYTLSHEIAHAIDPCEVKHFNALPKAYEQLIACFVTEGWVDPNRSTCGPNEQISEVFADWLAAELAGRAIVEVGQNYESTDKVRAAINTVRDLCEQPVGDSLNLMSHQHPRVRIGSVIGESPSIRAALGCIPERKGNYCRLLPTSTRAVEKESK